MRTLLRYLVFFGVLVGLAFAVVSIEVGGQTLYRRYRLHRLAPQARAWVDSLWASWKSPAKKPAPKSVPKVQHDPRASERVAILRRATRAAAPDVRTQPAKRRTRVDARASPQQKKALDELVTSRVGRR